VLMVEYAFQLPSPLPAGLQVWEVVNAGQQGGAPRSRSRSPSSPSKAC
jgi:hypothetical protein